MIYGNRDTTRSNSCTAWRLHAVYRESRMVWILFSTVRDYGFFVQRILYFGFQSLVAFRNPWVVFWTPEPRISDSTSKDFSSSISGIDMLSTFLRDNRLEIRDLKYTRGYGKPIMPMYSDLLQIVHNYSSSPNGLWVNSPWDRRPNWRLIQRPWGREE